MTINPYINWLNYHPSKKKTKEPRPFLFFSVLRWPLKQRFHWKRHTLRQQNGYHVVWFLKDAVYILSRRILTVNSQTVQSSPQHLREFANMVATEAWFCHHSWFILIYIVIFLGTTLNGLLNGSEVNQGNIRWVHDAQRLPYSQNRFQCLLGFSRWWVLPPWPYSHDVWNKHNELTNAATGGFSRFLSNEQHEPHEPL